MALPLEVTFGASLVLCAALSALAYAKNVLTWDGSVAAFAVGLVIGVLGDVTWLLLLLFFLLSSFLATRYRFALKEALGVQEGKQGERRSTNVLANGVAPVAVAVLARLGVVPWEVSGLLFLSVLAVAGADTLASEIGVLSPNAYLISSGKKVTPGTDGAVSLLGQVSAFVAASYTALVGWLVLAIAAPAYGISETVVNTSPQLVIVPAVVGFAGCQLDSVLGATLERRGIIGKRSVNLLATCSGGVIAFGILRALGAL